MSSPSSRAITRSKDREKADIVLGDIGLSLEGIEKGKPGQAAFNGQRVEIIAMDDVPRYADLVVVDLPNRVRLYERSVRGLKRATGVDIKFLESEANGHFQASLALNAKGDENLSGLLVNEIEILSVALQAKQQLHYRAWFWSKNTFDDPDLDEDSYVDHVELDLENFGARIGGANQFYLNSRLDPPLRYVDEDATRELHISLQNKSTTAKDAGVGGQVKLRFMYSPLEEAI